MFLVDFCCLHTHGRIEEYGNIAAKDSLILKQRKLVEHSLGPVYNKTRNKNLPLVFQHLLEDTPKFGTGFFVALVQPVTVR